MKGRVLVVDDDTALASVRDDTVREGAPGRRPVLEFPVTLSHPSTRDVTVTFATRDGTARAGQDYRARIGRLVVPAGSTRVMIKVEVFGDARREGNETLFVVLSGPVGDGRATGVVVNDD